MEDLNDISEKKVEFENQWEQMNKNFNQKKASKIVELTMRYSGGIIKNERQASYLILTISILITVISLFSIFADDRVPNIPPPANYPPLQ